MASSLPYPLIAIPPQCHTPSVPRFPFAGAKVLISPVPHKPKLAFSPDLVVGKGKGYNAQQQKRRKSGTSVPVLSEPHATLQPLQLFGEEGLSE